MPFEHHFDRKVKRSESPELYVDARFGINYTPDIYSFNIQTSTKTLEYLTSGLPVISNRYIWIESFSKNVNQEIIWLNDFIVSGLNFVRNIHIV